MRNLIADVTSREAWELNGWPDRLLLIAFPAIAAWHLLFGDTAWGLATLGVSLWQLYDMFLQAAVIKLRAEAEKPRENQATLYNIEVTDVDTALKKAQEVEKRWRELGNDGR